MALALARYGTLQNNIGVFTSLSPKKENSEKKTQSRCKKSNWLKVVNTLLNETTRGVIVPYGISIFFIL